MSRVHQRLARLSILLIAAYAVNWIVGPAIFSLHEHVWCVEHHQLRHVHDHTQHEDGHHHHNDVPLKPRHRAAVEHDQPCCSPIHEECPLQSQLLQPRDTERIGTQPDGPDDGFCRWSLHRSSAHQTRLRFAPKQSPPMT
ncbi:MAG: hypothetical protein ISR64_01530 [Deltaproteobacteria bacterium]|nr:hypothetical protein [Deltaproteobacteria bacterium]